MKIISTQYRVFQLKYLTLSHQKMLHLQVFQAKTNDKFCKASTVKYRDQIFWCRGGAAPPKI